MKAKHTDSCIFKGTKLSGLDKYQDFESGCSEGGIILEKFQQHTRALPTKPKILKASLEVGKGLLIFETVLPLLMLIFIKKWFNLSNQRFSFLESL